MIPGSANPLLLATAGGYAIERSLRFNSSDSAYLSLAVPTGTSTTFTASLWIKRSSISATYKHFLFTSDTANSGAGCGLGWTNGNAITVYNSAHNTTSGVYRDVSAWYHITLSVNAGTATLYVNGEQQVTGVTGFQLNGTAYIGRYIINDYYFDGYMADIYLVDGEALTPSSFTEIDSNGILQPIKYTGSYGTRGFHLPFSNNSTAAALGTDTSGNGNTWTVNNISVAAGAGNDSLVDVPTNGTQTDTGVGGEVRGNYATLNPLSAGANVVLSNGNLQMTGPAAFRCSLSSIAVTGSGKWYTEIVATTSVSLQELVGIATTTDNIKDTYLGATATSYGYYNNGQKYNNASAATYGASWTTGDVIGIALDLDAGTLVFYKNGSSQGTAYSGLSSSLSYCFVLSTNSTSSVLNANFGQRPFAYTAPSGFKALCTANLPAPTIEDGSAYMDILLWTGDGAQTRSLTGLNFQPDLVWMKIRTNTPQDHQLYDSVRGAGGGKCLASNTTAVEGTANAFPDADYGYVSSFDSTGFSVDDGAVATTGGYVNYNARTYVAWTWDAGSSTVTNTQGSITSSVRANPTAGFSIVTWNGGGSGYSVGHGLGVAPKLYIIKNRDSTSDWPVFTTIIDGSLDYLYLNTTAAKGDSGSSLPTSTLVYPGQSASSNYVMYCFAPVAGYSAFGSYTGNGSTDGPFVYTGFRPKWLMIKNTDSAFNWFVYDAARNAYNMVGQFLKPNSSDQEGSFDSIDFVSNGFKMRDSAANNASGENHIFMAFAENPFSLARAR